MDGRPSLDEIFGGGGTQTANAQDKPSLDEIFNGSNDQQSSEITGNPGKTEQIPEWQNVVGQFGKAIYNNPLAHPVLKALSDATGSNAEQAYGNLPEPQTVAENVGAGLGSAVPVALASAPLMKASGMVLEGLVGASRNTPILGKLTSLLKDSTIAKSALTGYSYGRAEGETMKAQGADIDPHSYATQTMGQFMMWAGLSRGGATLAQKFLPKDLPMAAQIVSKLPPSLKAAYTPEGLGSIAGGMIAGAMGAPNDKQGLAGAIVGGALSALNPTEQFQFKQGMGKGMGFGGVRYITDHWGKPFKESNDVIEQNGMDDVVQAATRQAQDAQGNPLSVPQQVFEAHKQAIGEVKQDLGEQYSDALVKNENINPQGMESFLSRLRQRVNSIQDPQSPVAKRFNNLYDSLVGFRNKYMETDILGTKQNPTGVNSGYASQEVAQSLPAHLRENYLKQIAAQTGKNAQNFSALTLNGLHQLKIEMQDMVGADAYAGERPYTSDEREASGLSRTISKFIGSENEAYRNVNAEYSKMKDIEGVIYSMDANKMTHNKFNLDETKRNQHDATLNKISNYLKSQGKGNYDSRKLLNKYYAFQTYNSPSAEGLAKNYPVRTVMAALVGGGLQSTGLPGGYLIGGLAGWHLGNPAAWIPILRGASIARDAKNTANLSAASRALSQYAAARP